MRLTVVLASSAFILTAVACGGASETELFSVAGDSQLSSGTGNPGASSGGPGPSSGGSSSSNGGGGSSSDGSSSGDVEDAGPGDPPAPPDDPTIACGLSDCAAGTEVCCARRDVFERTFTCQASGTSACIGALAIACDDRTDCPTDQVCCGILTSTNYVSVSCRKSCQSTTGTTRAARFCDPEAAVDECAAIGKSCLESQALPGYYVCQD